MSLSRFQRDIIERLISSMSEDDVLISQLNSLKLESCEHNGYEILYRYKSPDIAQSRINNAVFDGLEIFSSEMNSSASAAVFLKDGFISFLQILSQSGELPESELTDYLLINCSVQNELT